MRTMNRLLLSVFLVVGCTGKEKPENTLRIVTNINVKGLDPAISSDGVVSLAAGNIFDGLLTYDYFQEKNVLIPALAEAMPVISKDGLTYTFKIKKGIVFQDDPAFKDGKGREVVASDFVYSWKRIADPRLRGESYWLIDGKIKGLEEWRKAISAGTANYETPVDGLQTPDSNTIVIRLVKPYYQLLYALAMVPMSVVPREAVEKYGAEFLNHPVGTGAFRLKEWVRNGQIVLEKNPTYRKEFFPQIDGSVDSGKALPLVDRLVLYEVIEDQPRWLNFMKGEYDFSGIPKDSYDSAIDPVSKNLKPELVEKGIALQRRFEPDLTYTAINMEDPFLGKHKKVRQAMSLALQRKVLIEKFYNGRAIAAQSLFPPDTDGYEEGFKNPYTEHDLKKAKALLAEAGFPEGKGIPEIVYESTNSTTARQMSEFFQQEMSAIGIKIRIQTNTWPEMNEKIKMKKAQMWGIAWVGDYPDGENFLQLLYSKNKSPGSNGSNYDNPEFDKLYEAALRLPPGKERTKIYKKLRDFITEETPWLLNTHRETYALSHSWVRNYHPAPLVKGFHRFIAVDAEGRVNQKTKL